MAPSRPKGSFIKYWWRAQVAAYLVRPNAATLAALQQMRLNASMHVAVHRPSKPSQSIPMPFPLPRGTISAHVRHGDKAIEMPLVPFTKYVQAAEHLVATNPLTYYRGLFVSSEDPSVINDTARLRATRTGGWC